MRAIFDDLIDASDDVLSSLIVPHPREHLRSLPIQMRWEVTRRHPYYCLSWRRVRDVCQGKAGEDELNRMLDQLAVYHLRAIGVSMCPPDPAVEFDELGGEELNSAWLSGAVHPVTFGGMVNWLLAALPKETLTQLGLLFVEAGEPDRDDAAPAKAAVMNKLLTTELPGLELISQEPIISVDTFASEQKVVEAVKTLMRQWREGRKLPEQRDRSDKYPEYLEVWDLREGWEAGQYHRDRELTLREVAERKKRTVQTVVNQYKSAFELITGHSFSRPLWFKLFGGIKLSELMGQEAGRVSRFRPLVQPTPRPIPESVLLAGEDGSTAHAFAAMATTPASTDESDLFLDIDTLVDRGLSDQQIVDKLDLTPAALDGISMVRRRLEDGI